MSLKLAGILFEICPFHSTMVVTADNYEPALPAGKCLATNQREMCSCTDASRLHSTCLCRTQQSLHLVDFINFARLTGNEYI